MAYVDYKVLESLLIEGEDIIATEGIGDKLKAIGDAVGKTLLRIISIIRNAIKTLVEKVKNLFSKKSKMKSSTGASTNNEISQLKNDITKLEKDLKTANSKQIQADNSAIIAKLNTEENKNKALQYQLDNITDDKEKATKLIAHLKKQLLEKEKEFNDSIKNVNEEKKNESMYSKLILTTTKFVAQVSQHINKAYTELPKLISFAKTHTGPKIVRDANDDEFEVYDKFMDEIDRNVPTMASGSWSYLYKTLKYDYMAKLESGNIKIEFESSLGNSLEQLITQSNKCLDYLEKIVADYNSNKENASSRYYKMIITNIIKDEGFTSMLNSSINLVNKLLTYF